MHCIFLSACTYSTVCQTGYELEMLLLYVRETKKKNKHSEEEARAAERSKTVLEPDSVSKMRLEGSLSCLHPVLPDHGP